MELGTPTFWLAVLEIIAINVVLSGDNAVVIALACRNLSPLHRRKGMFWGISGAVVLRVILTTFAAGLLAYPYLKLTGGVLLIWIGISLLQPEDGEGQDVEGADHVWGSIKTIIVADCVMSLDNVVGVAAASRGNLLLLVFGLAVSIPLIVWFSQQIMKLMERVPLVVTLGAGLLGYVAGDMMAGDTAVHDALDAVFPAAEQTAGLLGAVLVVSVGQFLARRAKEQDQQIS